MIKIFKKIGDFLDLIKPIVMMLILLTSLIYLIIGQDLKACTFMLLYLVNNKQAE